MGKVDNGGSNAIRGFNYQKAIIVLIAVLNYLNDDFEIYVEAEDDIVVSLNGQKTYIQAKSNTLGVATITRRPKDKDSIIEKNLSNGEDGSGNYKLITPEFTNKDKHLVKAEPAFITKGAKVYTYSEEGFKQLDKKLPNLSKVKLKSSKVALTAFKADYEDALMQIMGIMAHEGITVDNNYGKASLQELCNEIDERSEFVVENESDFEKKKFTHQNLSNIFSHTYKLQYFNDILDSLGLSIAMGIDIKKKRINIRAIYGAYHDESISYIKALNIRSMTESEVVNKTIEAIGFNDIVDEIEKQAIVIDAFSEVLFERAKI